VKTLVLDIEGTLVSNAVSIFPRHELYKFLEFVKTKFDRIVVMTCLEERKFREVAHVLCVEGSAPKWFENLEWINWSKFYFVDQPQLYKNLKFINEDISDIYIIDDMERYIDPDQKSQWIPIESFSRPYRRDKEFKRLMKVIETICTSYTP
jgi:hypothetical protein